MQLFILTKKVYTLFIWNLKVQHILHMIYMMVYIIFRICILINNFLIFVCMELFLLQVCFWIPGRYKMFITDKCIFFTYIYITKSCYAMVEWIGFISRGGKVEWKAFAFTKVGQKRQLQMSVCLKYFNKFVVQPRASVRMHLVRAYVMPKHTVTLQK